MLLFFVFGSEDLFICFRQLQKTFRNSYSSIHTHILISHIPLSLSLSLANTYMSRFLLLLVISICHTPIYTLAALAAAGGGGGGGGIDKGFNILETASRLVPQGAIVGTTKESWKFVWQRMMAELAPQDQTGSYTRPSYSFQGKIGSSTFPDEADRYVLYVGNPCPWCHRTKLVCNVRKLSSREVEVVQLVDDPLKASRGGWVFDGSRGKDPIFNSRDLFELYNRLSPGFKGRCTAPLLVDRKSKKAVSNESSDIVRMLGEAKFQRKDDGTDVELYPSQLAAKIDATNDWVYKQLNNGVYRCGFSTRQDAYNAASKDVRNGLDRCEEILATQDFLCGDTFTEADIRLLPTVLRFDGVYSPLFKAGGSHLRIRDYPNLHNWLRKCWNIDGVRESIDLKDANESYYKQLFPLNPGGIVPTSITAKDIGLE